MPYRRRTIVRRGVYRARPIYGRVRLPRRVYSRRKMYRGLIRRTYPTVYPRWRTGRAFGTSVRKHYGATVAARRLSRRRTFDRSAVAQKFARSLSLGKKSISRVYDRNFNPRKDAKAARQYIHDNAYIEKVKRAKNAALIKQNAKRMPVFHDTKMADAPASVKSRRIVTPSSTGPSKKKTFSISGSSDPAMLDTVRKSLIFAAVEKSAAKET